MSTGVFGSLLWTTASIFPKSILKVPLFHKFVCLIQIYLITTSSYSIKFIFSYSHFLHCFLPLPFSKTALCFFSLILVFLLFYISTCKFSWIRCNLWLKKVEMYRARLRFNFRIKYLRNCHRNLDSLRVPADYNFKINKCTRSSGLCFLAFNIVCQYLSLIHIFILLIN